MTNNANKALDLTPDGEQFVVPSSELNPNRMATNYWQINEAWAIGATEKAGATSIMFALRRMPRLTPLQVTQRSLSTRLWLRHPIVRFASAFAYFAPNDNFPIQPSRAAYRLAEHPTIEAFTDAVLDQGMRNEHWDSQLGQHMPIDDILRFENINETFPFPIDHRNKGRIPKPKIIYRRTELNEFYQEDLAAWRQANV
jgi:hypothetical protein